MIRSLMNEGGGINPKKFTQTAEILVWWKKLSNGKLEKGKSKIEKLRIKSEIYDRIVLELPKVKRASIRRAVNTHLGWTQQPKQVKKVEVSA